jgi:hypothetical protein
LPLWRDGSPDAAPAETRPRRSSEPPADGPGRKRREVHPPRRVGAVSDAGEQLQSEQSEETSPLRRVLVEQTATMNPEW